MPIELNNLTTTKAKEAKQQLDTIKSQLAAYQTPSNLGETQLVLDKLVAALNVLVPMVEWLGEQQIKS